MTQHINQATPLALDPSLHFRRAALQWLVRTCCPPSGHGDNSTSSVPYHRLRSSLEDAAKATLAALEEGQGGKQEDVGRGSDARARVLAAARMGERVSNLVQHTVQRLRAEGAVFIDGESERWDGWMGGGGREVREGYGRSRLPLYPRPFSWQA